MHAQCSEIYFYRVNSLLQSDSEVYLIQDGKIISRIGLGDRYKATVCSSGIYEFVVKMNPDNVTLSSKTIEISAGQNYYLKIASPVGVEVATITNVQPSKGKQEVKKGSKFTSELKTIQIVESPRSVAFRPSEPPITEPLDNETFQRSQIVNNFKFDIINIS